MVKKQNILTNTGGGQTGNILKIIIVLVVCVVVYQIYKAVKGASEVVGGAIGNAATSSQTGIPIARIEVCKTVADKVYEAIWNYKWGAEEDEEAVIAALNQLIDAKEAAYTSVYYHQAHNGGLKADMQYLNSSEQSRINPTILHNLK